MEKRTKLAVVLCICLVLGLTLVAFFAQSHEPLNDVPSPKGVKTNEDRVRYLESYGWQVGDEPVSVEELQIPDEFDETYNQYLELQANQGFDLTKYQGKRVKHYTYEVTNYPTGETGVQAGLLVYKNTVIGGDVLSSSQNGFIHGLTMPK